jgi:uncharacterized alkaline shock family protein YloU
MDENGPGPMQEDLGDIKINNKVIATITSLAAVEVDGIVGLAGKGSPSELFGRKDMEKGVQVVVEDNSAEISIEVNVEYGVDIYKAAHQLQKAIKNAVERMTGLVVRRVNVSIPGIIVGEQPRRSSANPSPEIKTMTGS